MMKTLIPELEIPPVTYLKYIQPLSGYVNGWQLAKSVPSSLISAAPGTAINKLYQR